MAGRKRTKTASSDSRRAPFSIGGSFVAAGSHARIEIPVGRLPVGTWLSLPVEIVHGLEEGPTIWLSAAIHGDELNGIPIIRRTLRKLDAKTLRGTVVAVPVVNVFGLVNESRYLPDRRDLNRCFPGSARGSLASQLAHLFMTEVVSKCELGIDYHTGSGGRANLPQVRCDMDDDSTRSAAYEFSPPVLFHSRVRDGSLRAAACELGIGVLLYEAGEASRFSAEAIDTGVQGTLRVMEHLAMIPETAISAKTTPVAVRQSKWMRATRSGFLEITVALGAQVTRGDNLGRLYSTLDHKDYLVKAGESGVVLGYQTAALVHRGDGIVHIGTA